MRLRNLFGIAAIALGAATSANAATLDINTTADNAFSVYLAQGSDATLGTFIGSGSDWRTDYTFSTTLSGTSPYYLQFVVTNFTTANGYPQYGSASLGGNPSALLADLGITGTGFVLADFSTSDSTNTTDWLGSTTTSPGTWVPPTNPVTGYGANNDTSTIWYKDNGNSPVSGISGGAEWIYYGDESTALYADLVIEILPTATNGQGSTPLPATLTMFAGGLGLMGAFMRKRKKAPVAA